MNANHDDKEIRSIIYKSFFSPENEEDWLETKEEVLKWIPEKGLHPKDSLPSHSFGLLFLIDMHIRELLIFPKESFGREYDRFHLYRSSQKGSSKEILEQQVTLFIENAIRYAFEIDLLNQYGKYLLFLSVEQWKSIPTTLTMYEQEDTSFLVADIIEGWFAILHGWDHFDPHENDQDLSLSILNTLKKHVSKEVFKKILVRWRRKVKIYDDLIADINLSSDLANKKGHSLKQVLKTRRTTIQKINKLASYHN